MKICIDQREVCHPTGKHIYTASLIRSLRQLGHQLTIPHHHSSTPIFYLKLARLCAQTDYLISPLSFIPPILSNKPSATVIYDLAFTKKNFKTNPKATLLEKALFSLSLSRSTDIIVISKAIQTELRHQAPHLNSHLISPTINQINQSYPHPANIPRIPYTCYIGTLEPRKNLIRLIQAHLRADNAPLLVIAGKIGWHSQPILNEIKKYPQKVKYLGRISTPQKHALLHHCLYLSMPSLYEGFGLPVLEAISHHKASLISHDPALSEVAGNTAHQVDATDTSSITRGIELLANESTYRHHLESNTYSQRTKYLPQVQQAQLTKLLLKQRLSSSHHANPPTNSPSST